VYKKVTTNFQRALQVLKPWREFAFWSTFKYVRIEFDKCFNEQI